MKPSSSHTDRPPATAIDPIHWFREASPYINAHRHRVLILCVPDHMLDAQLTTLAHDLTLLSHLGLKLVVCFGLRAQIDTWLEKPDDAQFVDGRRVTDDRALAAIVAAAGQARSRFEAQLSTALPNTPSTGSRIYVSSGNFVSGQPFGIHRGVDFLHTGAVREVQAKAICPLLEAGHVVLLPPLGYSLTGELFNLPAEEVALETAVALQADKLVYFVPQLPADSSGAAIRQCDAAGIEQTAGEQDDADFARTLARAAVACRRGVVRVHLLDQNDPQALLTELYTRDGSGTLVTATPWETLRAATITDVGGIIDLITPLQADGTLASRSREQLELDIDHFVVCEREHTVVACAALYVDDGTAEIACVATHPQYRGEGRADRLIGHLEARARDAGCNRAIVLSTRTAHWFVERGYREAGRCVLPGSRQRRYDRQRNSKVFVKQLEGNR